MSKNAPTPNLAGVDHLHVLDMGLDFRSYLNRVDESNNPVLGNIISYPAEKVADVFEPTVYIDHSEGNSESKGKAQDARDLIANYTSSGNVTYSRDLCENLFQLLDQQCGFKGAQAPSQRKMPRDPKGAFCNLHLADHRCYQEFACNQLHLHEAGPVRHRLKFFQKLAEVLLDEKRPHAEVVNRVKDSIFFARYGNKVTVKFHGNWAPFFKTLYTDGRLEQAFRQQQYSCNDYSCRNEHCKGIHCQEKKLPPTTKAMDLHNANQVAVELTEEAEHIVSQVESLRNHPPEMTLSAPAIAQNDLWKTTVRDYVRQSGIKQVEADETLLKTLQDVKICGTPMSSCSDRMTPLLDDDVLKFNFSLSSTNSESH